MRTKANLTTKDGIKWYYEQEGSGPEIVLIPDGFGECRMYDIPASIIAAQGFRVTTFDMPGMSRSSDAPPETYQDVTAQKLAGYIISLLDELGIQRASFFGCSSGASTVLALVVGCPDRVRNAIVHEAPTKLQSHLTALAVSTDDAIVDVLSKAMRNTISGNAEAWDALGDEAHARLRRNYVRWARGYPRTIPLSTPVGDLEALKRCPLDWTVGESTPTGNFIDNVVTATKLGAGVATLPGLHFPYVSHPEEFAQYIVATTRKYI